MTKSLRAAVYATVCWFEVCGQAATAEEIHRYLFDRSATLAEVKKSLYEDKRLGKCLGFWGRKTQVKNLVLPRHQGSFRARRLWGRVARWRWLLAFVPFVRLVAVGNTLAFGWPDRESDIDLFVVVERRRLFTARLLLTLLTQIFGLRRHGARVRERFCLSFFVSDTAADLQPLAIGKADPYLAFWLVTLVPIWSDFIGEFFRSNAWVKKTFPNWIAPRTQQIPARRGFARRAAEWLLSGWLGDRLEKKLKTWQLARARRKSTLKLEKTAVVISAEVLKFHETDARRQLFDKWRELVGAARD